jgi:hypothetical protein
MAAELVSRMKQGLVRVQPLLVVIKHYRLVTISQSSSMDRSRDNGKHNHNRLVRLIPDLGAALRHMPGGSILIRFWLCYKSLRGNTAIDSTDTILK